MINISAKESVISSVSVKWSVRVQLVHNAVERRYYTMLHVRYEYLPRLRVTVLDLRALQGLLVVEVST